jgi:hypothetical protein
VRGFVSRSRRRRVLGVIGLLAGLLCAVLIASTAWSWLSWSRWAVQAEAVAAARSHVAGPGDAILSFDYRGKRRFLTVAIDPAEATAAARLSTEGIFAQPGPLLDAYLGTLVRTQSRTATVDSLCGQLRAIREQYRLDGDEYLELMARAVQDIPYGTPHATFGLPVQLVADGKAVCSDKSLLLASLLLHEGYDTGVWTLDAERHVAVAVRALGGGFRQSGYAYVETTRRAYVGDVPDDYGNALPGTPAPRLIRAGGFRAYGADLESAFIVGRLRQAQSRSRALAPYQRYSYSSVASERWRRYYAAMATEHASMTQLARTLSRATDDRARVYELLSR